MVLQHVLCIRQSPIFFNLLAKQHIFFNFLCTSLHFNDIVSTHYNQIIRLRFYCLTLVSKSLVPLSPMQESSKTGMQILVMVLSMFHRRQSPSCAFSIPHMISRWNVSSPRVRFVDVRSRQMATPINFFVFTFLSKNQSSLFSLVTMEIRALGPRTFDVPSTFALIVAR